METLARCVQGESAALHQFVTCYQAAVFALLSRLLGRGPHVEDLAQETFLRAIRALPNFNVRGKALPSTWLLTIGTRLAIDARRRQAVAFEHARSESTHQVQSPWEHSSSPAADTPERHSMRAELRIALAEAAAALPVEQKDVFVLSELHGFSLSEVGAALDVQPGTVKTRLHRARQKLMLSLSQHHEELSR